MSNDTYKLVADAHHKYREFNEGDYVMVPICLELYLKYTVKKLNAQTIGTYHILRKFGSNAYLIDLPSNMSISPVFNIADSFPCRGTFEPPVLHSSISAGTSSTSVSCAFSPLL